MSAAQASLEREAPRTGKWRGGADALAAAVSGRAARRSFRGTLLLAVPLFVLTVVAHVTFTPANLRETTNFLITIVLVLGIQAFSGNSGIISFGHVAFMGVGAYVAALVATPRDMKELSVAHLPGWLMRTELGFLPTVAVAGAVTALVALVVGGGLVRMRENAMAMATFAILVIFSVIFASWNQFTGGAAGIYGIPGRVTIWWALAFAIAAIFALRVYRESRAGVKLRASSQDPMAAAALGAPVRTLRLGSWVLSAAVMGIGGGVWAQYNLAFGPQQFGFTQTFNLLAMLVVGGMASVSGAVAGTTVITLATEILRRVEDSVQVGGLTEIVVALTILVSLRARPGGLVGAHELDDTLLRSRPVELLRVGLRRLRWRSGSRRPARALLPFSRRLVEAADGTFEVWEAGTGDPTTVFFHPYLAFADPAPGGAVADALARAGRTIVILPRGLGSSTPSPGGQLGLGAAVADLEALRQALGLGRFCLSTSGLGGAVVLEYALRHPQEIAGLLLVGVPPSWRFFEDPASILSPAHPYAWREEGARRSLDGTPRTTRAWIESLHSTESRRGSVPASRLETPRVSVIALRALREDLLGDPPWDVEAKLGELECPALVVAGARDAQVPLSLSELLAARLPAAELVVFESSGGLPADDEPERFGAAVGSFLARLRELEGRDA